MQKFQDLRVWKEAHDLTLEVYKLTSAFPSDERFGLTSQLRRASVSVEANIAEGSKRLTGADFARFANIAEGSASEVACLLLIAKDLGYVDDVSGPIDRVGNVERMLCGLRSSINDRRSTMDAK
jgi:four helix bundle protein